MEIIGTGASELLPGGNGDDTILAGGGNDTSNGRDGNDLIDGEGGNDDLRGGKDDDLIFGGSGSDTLKGGEGDDTLVGGLGNDLYLNYVNDEAGDGTVFIELPGEGRDTLATSVDDYTLPGGVEIEEIILSQDALTFTGNEFGNQIGRVAGLDAGPIAAVNLDGAGGNDTLNGTQGDDTLDGGEGDDRLFGGLGNDLLDGGVGADRLTGGDGDDTYVVDDVGDRITEEEGEGTDTVISSASEFKLRANQEILILEEGAGDIIGRGNTEANQIFGNEGDNEIIGAAGDDTLDGGEGDDTLNGGADNDFLVGGSDVDLLIGGRGNDTLVGIDTLTGGENDETDVLVGGGDSDLFVLGDDELFYNNGDENDFATIQDFKINQGDQIQLVGEFSDYTFTSSVSGGTNIEFEGDLIAVVNNVSVANLSQETNFNFVGSVL
ncbi:MAG: calcium-binding protein [Oscillatoria sp. PMC 1068.18]|nr:calcium-binding protein [Oscillatoria sp. PMC 1076.18]MEC4989692.1 calcium-binding protein [Oscillatoria sp. PMC 1068.18]